MALGTFRIPRGYREIRGLGSSDAIIVAPHGRPPITEGEALDFFQRAGYYLVHTWRDPQDYGSWHHTLQRVSFWDDGTIKGPWGYHSSTVQEVVLMVTAARSEGDWRGARPAAVQISFGQSHRDHVLPMWIKQEEAARPGRFRALSAPNGSACCTHEWVDVLDTEGMYRDDWDLTKKPYKQEVYRIHQIVGHGTTANRLGDEDLKETYGTTDIRPFVTKKPPPPAAMRDLPKLPGK